MKRKQVWWILGVLGYLVLMVLLVVVERDNLEFRGFGDALWFSAVTLTTVGYGDKVPATFPGRVIALVFLIMSMGLQVAAMGAVIAFLRGRVFNHLRLRRWLAAPSVVFSSASELSVCLAADILRQTPSARLIFLHSRREDVHLNRVLVIPESLEAVVVHQDLSEATICLLEEDESENHRLQEMLKNRVKSCVVMGREGENKPEVVFFDPVATAARAYWQSHPLNSGETEVVLLGDGALAQQLISQGVVTLCRYPFEKTIYHLFGDWRSYRGEHARLLQWLGAEGDKADEMIFHDGLWTEQSDLMERASRIILCGDDPAENASLTAKLLRLFPLRGRVYCAGEALSREVIPFARVTDLGTRRMVMHAQLDRRARHMHEVYLQQSGGENEWAKLSPFERSSNRAAASHLLTKLRLLLPGRDVRSVTGEHLREAAEIWKNTQERDSLRECEHERWARFHLLLNWRLGDRKNERSRTHPCLRPYWELPEKERVKDNYAWDLLEVLAEKEE